MPWPCYTERLPLTRTAQLVGPPRWRMHCFSLTAPTYHAPSPPGRRVRPRLPLRAIQFAAAERAHQASLAAQRLAAARESQQALDLQARRLQGARDADVVQLEAALTELGARAEAEGRRAGLLLENARNEVRLRLQW
jgi:hypothetical protein